MPKKKKSTHGVSGTFGCGTSYRRTHEGIDDNEPGERQFEGEGEEEGERAEHADERPAQSALLVRVPSAQGRGWVSQG